MWTVKTFKTRDAFERFTANPNIQWYEIYVNNVRYAIEYRPLRCIY